MPSHSGNSPALGGAVGGRPGRRRGDEQSAGRTTRPGRRGLRLLRIRDVPVGDMLPALLVAPLLTQVVIWLR